MRLTAFLIVGLLATAPASAFTPFEQIVGYLTDDTPAGYAAETVGGEVFSAADDPTTYAQEFNTSKFSGHNSERGGTHCWTEDYYGVYEVREQYVGAIRMCEETPRDGERFSTAAVSVALLNDAATLVSWAVNDVPEKVIQSVEQIIDRIFG